MTPRLAAFAPLAAAIASLATSPALAAAYVQAPGSSLAFASSYDGETFSGTFPTFTTRVDFDPASPAQATLDVGITLAGARTGNADRDQTLQGADFFDVARFAQARYSARGFRHLGGNQYAADGTLSLRGVNRPVTLTFTWTPGARPVLAGKAVVKRLDFGVGGGDWRDTGTIPAEVAISTRVVLQPAK